MSSSRKGHGDTSLLKIFATGAVVTFGLGAMYIALVLIQIPAPQSKMYIVNTPNYSIFYLVFLPIAIGLICATVVETVRLRNPARGWKWLWAVCMIFVVFVVFPDALNKGPPLTPQQLQFQTENELKSALAISEFTRLRSPEDTQIPRRQEYVEAMAKFTGVAPESMLRFKDARDFIARASILAWADMVLTAAAGFAVVTLMVYLIYLRVAMRAQKLDRRVKDHVLLAYSILVAWFPFRIYSLWYDNYYSFSDAVVNGIIVAGVAAIFGVFLLLLLLKPGPVVSVLTAVPTVTSIAFGAIAKIDPQLLSPIGAAINSMSIWIFITIEVILLAMLLAVVVPYLWPPSDAREETHARATKGHDLLHGAH